MILHSPSQFLSMLGQNIGFEMTGSAVLLNHYVWSLTAVSVGDDTLATTACPLPFAHLLIVLLSPLTLPLTR